MTQPVSRRTLFKVAGAAGASAALPLPTQAQAPSHSGQPHAASAAPAARAGRDPYTFFNAAEAAFVEAAVERLIPADDRWPGARDAGVPTYIDRQLAGAYGAGARLYLVGPWKEGTPRQGYQLPFTPAQLYRTAIGDIAAYTSDHLNGASFESLSADQQDTILHQIETGAVDLPHVPGPVFFETLLSNTIEGFFADPAYGGNRNMAGWRMIGFPGAYASFVNEVDRHGMSFDREPIGMLAVVAEHMHK